MSTGFLPGVGLSLETDRDRPLVTALVGLAAAALAVRFFVAVVGNAPGALWVGPVGGVAVSATGLAAVALGAVGVTADPTAGVGLLFAGVFGGLAVLHPTVTVPAALAAVAGVAVFLWMHRDTVAAVPGAVAATLVSALAIALLSGVGGIASLRPGASTLALVGIGLTPVFAASNAGALLRGAGAFLAVVALGLALPFVTGAVTLVGVGSVGASLPVVAIAVAGAVTTASAAARTRRWHLLAGVALLAFAGVPATLARAVPFALGITTLVREVSQR